MIIPEQVRAARAFLDWSQRALAAERDRTGRQRDGGLEAGQDVRVSVLATITTTLTRAGIVFLDDGDQRDGGRGLRLRR